LDSKKDGVLSKHQKGHASVLHLTDVRLHPGEPTPKGELWHVEKW